jgi:hypothetical protein
MQHTSLPPIYSVQFAAGRWFAVAPMRRPHHAGLDRVELRAGIGRPGRSQMDRAARGAAAAHHRRRAAARNPG